MVLSKALPERPQAFMHRPPSPCSVPSTREQTSMAEKRWKMRFVVKSSQLRFVDMASKALPERPQASCVDPTAVALLGPINARANFRSRKSVEKMRLAEKVFSVVLLTWHPRPCPNAHYLRASIRPPSPCSNTISPESTSAPEIGENSICSKKFSMPFS
jgi:hypothetical protein